MKLTIYAKNMTVSPNVTRRIEKKTEKMGRYLLPDTEMQIRLSKEQKRDLRVVEITVPMGNNVFLRAEASEPENLFLAIDQALAKIERQIRRHRTNHRPYTIQHASSRRNQFAWDPNPVHWHGARKLRSWRKTTASSTEKACGSLFLSLRLKVSSWLFHLPSATAPPVHVGFLLLKKQHPQLAVYRKKSSFYPSPQDLRRRLSTCVPMRHILAAMFPLLRQVFW